MPDSRAFFSKSSHILFAAHMAMRARCPDLWAGLELARDAEADFASVLVQEERGGVLCGTGDDTRPRPLEDVLGHCARLGLPLCLFAQGSWSEAGKEALYACLGAGELPLLLAARDREFLALAGEKVPGLATGYVGELSDSCQIGGPLRASGVEVCLLPREIASGCRLCSMKGRGVFTCVIGNCTVPEVVRMSLDGADAFLLDDPGQFAFLRERQRQG